MKEYLVYRVSKVSELKASITNATQRLTIKGYDVAEIVYHCKEIPYLKFDIHIKLNKHKSNKEFNVTMNLQNDKNALYSGTVIVSNKCSVERIEEFVIQRCLCSGTDEEVRNFEKHING